MSSLSLSQQTTLLTPTVLGACLTSLARNAIALLWSSSQVPQGFCLT
ncbi:MAG: hypothetical protein AB4206_02680 [Xenococcaceae cyanobacterium]